MTSKQATRGYARSQRRSSSKPAYGWTNSTVLFSSVAIGAVVIVDLLGAFTTANKFNIGTILRLLLTIQYRGSAANFEVIGRVGVGVVSDDAFLASATPDPMGDESFGWYLNAPLLWDEPSLTYRRSDYDIRSARKLVGDASTLFLGVENSGISTAALEFQYGARLLYRKK